MGPLGVTGASLAALGPAAIPGLAAEAEVLGYQSFWVAEATGPEAFVTLTSATMAAPGLDLGTGVVPLWIRTPTLTAMGAATLQALRPERRILLGIGYSSPAVVERWHGGRLGDRPIGRTREFVALLRELWSGESVTWDGDYWSLKGARLGIRLGERRPELVLAALGPAMLRLAGEIADGVLLNYLPASHVPWSVEQVREGERQAHREPGSCMIYAYVHLGVGTRADGLTPARRDLFSYAVVPAYAANFSAAGFGDEVEAITAHHREGDRDGALAAVSEAMVDAIDIMGDADLVRSALAAYVDAGVEYPVVMPLPWGADRLAVVRATLEAAASM